MTEDVEGYLDWLGVKYRTVLDDASTGGSLSVTRSLSPAGSGPPRHIHHAEDETFFILDGRCDFWLKGEVFRRSAGETMFIPRGTERGSTSALPDHRCQPRMFSAETSSASFPSPRSTNPARPWRS